jgi:hypothetical protein
MSSAVETAVTHEAQGEAQGEMVAANEAQGETSAKAQLHGDQIFTVRGVLGKKECRMLVAEAEKRGFAKSSVSGGGHGRTGREDPVTNSFVVLDDLELAALLYGRVAQHVPATLDHLVPNPYFGPNQGWRLVCAHPRLRLYKYEPGDAYPEHIDTKARRISVCEDQSRVVQQSVYTLLVYLNDDFSGGQTGYWPDHAGIHCRFRRSEEKQHSSKKQHQVCVTPVAGMAVIQDQNILHEGLPTTKGVKYILRTDLVFERVVPRSAKLKNAPPEPAHGGEWERLFETSCKNYAI